MSIPDIAAIEARAKQLHLLATGAETSGNFMGSLAHWPGLPGGDPALGPETRDYYVRDLERTADDVDALLSRVRELEGALHCTLCGASLRRGCISCGHIRDEEEQP